MMNKGIFITVEGSDGSGKSTQIEFLKEYFSGKGIDAIFTREPGGTPISEKIRAIILDNNNSELDSMTETLLYAASRAQLVSQVIKPALERGKVVVCDRFVDSSLAYQQYARGLGESVSVINGYAISGCMPDVTFLLKVSPEVGLSRLTGSADRIESEAASFHQKVSEGYLALEKEYPDRIVGVDASNDPLAVRAEILSHIERILGERHGI